MSTRLTTLLVGSHFYPPAKTLLEFLPSGARVELRPEPENPYDPDAVQVWVEPGQVPDSQLPALAEALPLQGCTLEQFMSTGPSCLGHIARSSGKPLGQAQALPGMPPLVGNAEINGAGLAATSHQARLLQASSGAWLVEVEFEGAAP